MKKFIFILGLLASLGMAYADTPTSCGTFGSAGSDCSYCFTSSGTPYENDGITSSDRWTNTSSTQWQYLWVGTGRFSVGITPLNGSSWNQSDVLSNMFEIPMTSGTSGGVPYIFYYPGESSTWIRTKSGQFFRFVSHGSITSRTTPLFRIAYTLQVTPQTPNGAYGSPSTHKQCTFVYGKWCGDGILDSDKGEQCDTGASNGTGTCSSTCQNQTVASCTNLAVTPTSVTNGGSVTYTCTGTNATSYSIIAKKPDGTVLSSSTSAAGSITLPATPGGIYTVSCYINGQITTPASCEKTITNTVVNEAVCTDLSITPTSVTNGGSVTYTCSGSNVTSYSVVFSKPDGTTLQSLTTATGSVTVPATPTGTYTAKCYVNGQTTTPAACQKTVTNNTVAEPVCTGLTVTPPSVVNGGNVSYSCTGNNVSSYSVIFKKPDGTTLQSFTTSTGSVTIPATPLGTYSAQCYVNGQTTTPAECTKTVSNNTVITPTCDNLSVSTSGTTINYSCTGTNVSSYSILQNGTQISTNASGSINAGYGTHTLICYVNNSITSASCQKTVTINNPTYPQIQVVKDDNDNHDDSQFLQTGGAAQFTIVVRNPGSESLENVVLTDVYAPECNRGVGDTLNMISLIGNRDSRLDPGESFSYLCTRTNVSQGTFPNNENRVCVAGRGITSGTTVDSCDNTRVEFGTPVSICQNIQVSQNGTQTNVYCAPSGGYKLYVLQGTQVINTLQSPTGQFSLNLNDGNYKVVCLRDGEQTVQPSCQKSITINPKQDYCVLESAVQYGGAPLHTQLNCRSTTYAQCAINIMKDGKPWRSIATCHADMVFTERGVYDATCVIGDIDTQYCSTRVQVDIMTIIRTGPFLPILLALALGMAGYITYRRRKTA